MPKTSPTDYKDSKVDRIFKENLNKPRPPIRGSAITDYYKQANSPKNLSRFGFGAGGSLLSNKKTK
jgi:hypothetical protein